MSIEQHETFLNAAQVPLRLSVVVDGEPLIVPLWFFYQEGALWCACQRDSYLVRSLAEQEAETRKDLVCAFDVSTNTAPYLGVAGKALLFLLMNRGSDRRERTSTRPWQITGRCAARKRGDADVPGRHC